MLNQLNQAIVHFEGTLLGLEQLDAFHIESMDEMEMYVYIQSDEDEYVGFLAANPFLFFKEYEFELSEQDKQELKIATERDVLVLGIITIREPFQESTMNLLAPLVINVRTMRGKQIVLHQSEDYSTKESFLNAPQAAGGDSEC